MKNIGLLISTFVLLVILGFVACNKNETEKNQEMNRVGSALINGNSSYILGYLDSDTNIVYANYSELEKIYFNAGILNNLYNKLIYITPTSTVGSDGVTINGIRTRWISSDSTYFNILSQVFVNVNNDGLNEYILGESRYIKGSWSCVCESTNCGSGCQIIGDDPRFCDCSYCHGGVCKKTHTLISSPSKY